MSDDTRTMLAEQMTATLDTLEALEDAASRGTWHDEDTHPDSDWCQMCADLVSEYGYDDPQEALDARPLDVVAEIGKPLTVLLTCGGPHIEVSHDLSNGRPTLEGWWGSEHVTMTRGELLDRVMAYFLPEFE